MSGVRGGAGVTFGGAGAGAFGVARGAAGGAARRGATGVELRATRGAGACGAVAARSGRDTAGGTEVAGTVDSFGAGAATGWAGTTAGGVAGSC